METLRTFLAATLVLAKKGGVLPLMPLIAILLIVAFSVKFAASAAGKSRTSSMFSSFIQVSLTPAKKFENQTSPMVIVPMFPDDIIWLQSKSSLMVSLPRASTLGFSGSGF